VLDLVLRLIELYVDVTPEQRMAVALWCLHGYVFGRFTISPRLALLSPVRGCGKTTLLALLDLLCADPYRTDNVSAASIYHLLGAREHTLLIDEGDNLGLLNNSVLRSVFNAGHRKGGAISRFVSGRSRKFLVHAPLAVAAIGTLPLPLMHRAIIIDMQRRPPDVARQQQEIDEADPTFPAAREQIRKWTATCVLSRQPEMPPELTNRAADNWRVLFAIADDLGHGAAARAAAIALHANRIDEDPGIILLTDIRTVFDTFGTDRVVRKVLIANLINLNSLWSEWRGLRDDQPPHKCTAAELGHMLRNFGIRARTVWPLNRRPEDKSDWGYYRSQFEAAWAAYCPADDTATQRSGTIRLLKP
jgi:hypothetical protein